MFSALGLVVEFRENSPPGLAGSVQLFPALMDGDRVIVDLCEDGVVVMGKRPFRELARMAPDSPIGKGKLVWLVGDVGTTMTRDETATFLLAFAAKINESVDMPLEERGRIIQMMMDECTDEQKLLVVRLFQAAAAVPRVVTTPTPPTIEPETPPEKPKHRHKRPK